MLQDGAFEQSAAIRGAPVLRVSWFRQAWIQFFDGNRGWRTRRCSEREPTDSLRDKSNVIGGWLPSLTLVLDKNMKCPKCSADFPLTWRLYLKAPFGKFPYPCCKTALAGKHRWWYWPLMALGCCAFGVPFAYIAGTRFGWQVGLVAWVIGCLLSGMPFDKYLENRFAILTVRQDRSSKSQ